MYKDVYFWARMSVILRQGRRWFHAAASFSSEKLDVEQCTRKYTVQQAIFKSAGDVGIRTADQKYI